LYATGKKNLKMTDEATPETRGVTPRYVLQHNAISRSIQNLSANAKKLTAMTMALLPADLSCRTAAFTFTEFCKALGIEYGGKTRQLLKDAVKECMQSTITVELPNKNWKIYTWFSVAECDETTGVCTMTFSEALATVLLDLKRIYAKINLKDMGKLQSKYALRFFELAKSYESLAGKDGNRSGYWYFERSLPELRQLLAVPPEAYPATDNFRRKVVEGPVKELNEAQIGITIETTGIKQGRNLKAIRFTCQQTVKKLPAKRSRGHSRKTATAPDKQLLLPEATPETTREAKELEHLKELYPETFTALYTEELTKPSFLPPTDGFRKRVAEAAALLKLRDQYGIVK
jgi:plasmid replication initiation protein